MNDFMFWFWYRLSCITSKMAKLSIKFSDNCLVFSSDCLDKAASHVHPNEVES